MNIQFLSEHPENPFIAIHANAPAPSPEFRPLDSRYIADMVAGTGYPASAATLDPREVDEVIAHFGALYIPQHRTIAVQPASYADQVHDALEGRR